MLFDEILEIIKPAIVSALTYSYTRDSLMSSSSNSEDSDEMPHNEVFYQCLH